MALSAAERQRRRRQRIAENPQLHAEAKAKERRRWAARKAAGKIVTANELSDRALRRRRAYWRSVKKKKTEEILDKLN